MANDCVRSASVMVAGQSFFFLSSPSLSRLSRNPGFGGRCQEVRNASKSASSKRLYAPCTEEENDKATCLLLPSDGVSRSKKEWDTYVEGALGSTGWLGAAGLIQNSKRPHARRHGRSLGPNTGARGGHSSRSRYLCLGKEKTGSCSKLGRPTTFRYQEREKKTSEQKTGMPFDKNQCRQRALSPSPKTTPHVVCSQWLRSKLC